MIDTTFLAAKYDPRNPIYHRNRAAAFVNLKMYNEAADAAKKALELKPDYEYCKQLLVDIKKLKRNCLII